MGSTLPVDVDLHRHTVRTIVDAARSVSTRRHGAPPVARSRNRGKPCAHNHRHCQSFCPTRRTPGRPGGGPSSNPCRGSSIRPMDASPRRGRGPGQPRRGCSRRLSPEKRRRPRLVRKTTGNRQRNDRSPSPVCGPTGPRAHVACFGWNRSAQVRSAAAEHRHSAILRLLQRLAASMASRTAQNSGQLFDTTAGSSTLIPGMRPANTAKLIANR